MDKKIKTYDQPQFQSFHIEGVKHISPAGALEALNKSEAIMIDVREPDETCLESFVAPNLLYHPMLVIMDRLDYMAKDQFIIVACTGGINSTRVANLLNMQGYPEVANLDGGLMMWKMQGLPFESNLSSSCSGCSCSCSK